MGRIGTPSQCKKKIAHETTKKNVFVCFGLVFVCVFFFGIGEQKTVGGLKKTYLYNLLLMKFTDLHVLMRDSTYTTRY